MAVFVPLLVLLGLGVVVQVSAECCSQGKDSAFCAVFSILSIAEQAEVRAILGDDCDDETLQKMDKRKPNFIRFGRSDGGLRFGKKGSDPNFLRFGRSSASSPADPNFLRFGKAANSQNFLRFGKSKPNFLRFGRSDPNFLRFGKAASADPNFLRFGKRGADEMEMFTEPNFLRFGKRAGGEKQMNFLRFGRAVEGEEQFDREYRKPNFLRFG